MSAGDDCTQEGSYGYAEVVPNTELTLAQWARAEALKAVMASNAGAPLPLAAPRVRDMVNIYAELIVTGDIPKPAPGTCY